MMHVFAIALCSAIFAGGVGTSGDARAHDPRIAARRDALHRFIARTKFEREFPYPGARNEAERKAFESSVNDLALRLIDRLEGGLLKDDVLNEFKPTLALFEREDSDDKDRMLEYLEDIMDIFEIESSDGMLSNWRYGFNTTTTADVRNAQAVATMSQEEKQILGRLTRMKAASALTSMTEIFGQPTATTPGGATIWIRGAKAETTIGLTKAGGQTTLVWMSEGRFTYSCRLY